MKKAIATLDFFPINLSCQPPDAYIGVYCMTLSLGYLTSKQKLIWDLKSKGLSEANIARKLDVTRQTVHKALDIANSKLSTALEEVANLNKINVKTMDSAKGILVGYSLELGVKTVVTFSARNGVQIWYRTEGDCKNCGKLQICREILLTEAQDRNIQLHEDTRSMLPSELAEALFSKIAGE